MFLIICCVSPCSSVVGVEAKLSVMCSTVVLPEVVSAAETYIGQENKELIRISKCEDVSITTKHATNILKKVALRYRC